MPIETRKTTARIDGKTWWLSEECKTKAGAKIVAAKERKLGHKARVLPRKVHGGRTYWCTWYLKKGR